MDIESIIPVLEPATFSRSPTTVRNPIITPPSIVATGMVYSKVLITDFSVGLAVVSYADLMLFA